VTLALLLNKKSPDRIQERRTTPRRTRKKKKTEEQERRSKQEAKKEAQNNIQHETKPNHEKQHVQASKEKKYTAEREIPIAGLPSPSIQLSSEVNCFACPPLHILIPRSKF
jgi:hypothetical protein